MGGCQLLQAVIGDVAMLQSAAVIRYAVGISVARSPGHDNTAHFIPAAFKSGAFRAQIICQGNVIAYLHGCYPRVLRNVDKPPDRFGLFTVSDSFNLRLLLV